MFEWPLHTGFSTGFGVIIYPRMINPYYRSVKIIAKISIKSEYHVNLHVLRNREKIQYFGRTITMKVM